MVVWVSFLATITILTDIPTGWLGGSSIISNMSKSKRFENQVSSIKNIGVPSPLSSSRQHRGFETFSLRDPNLNWYSYKMGSYELRLGKPYIYIYNKQGFLTSVKPIYKGIYKGYWFLDTYLVDCPRTKSVSFYNSTQARISGGGKPPVFPESPMDPHVVSMWCLTAKKPECLRPRHVGSSHQGGRSASHGLPGIK